MVSNMRKQNAKPAKKTKAKPVKVDGLSPKDKQKIRNAVRQIWQRSYPRKLCVQRAIGPDGFPVCEKCGKTVPKVAIDHMQSVGELDGGFISRLFCSSDKLQALCKECHQQKTNAENRARRLKAKAKQDDFY